MIVRRYGQKIQSVEPIFDSRALTEITFRRTPDFSMDAESFFGSYRRSRVHELTAETEGPVQDEAEQALLRRLEEKLQGLSAELEEGELLLIESEQGRDYPKTKDRKKTLVVDGENRLYFYWRVDPPLRAAVFQREPEGDGDSGGAGGSGAIRQLREGRR